MASLTLNPYAFLIPHKLCGHNPLWTTCKKKIYTAIHAAAESGPNQFPKYGAIITTYHNLFCRGVEALDAYKVHHTPDMAL